MSGWRLLLTRPDEECAALAASLGEAGVHSSSLPLLAIDPLEETPEQRTLMLDLDRYCAVVVVSKPAAANRPGWRRGPAKAPPQREMESPRRVELRAPPRVEATAPPAAETKARPVGERSPILASQRRKWCVRR